MVIEGHTAATEPESFWTQIALNRAELLADRLHEKGVPPLMAIPLGCTGGASQFDVRPATLSEIFDAIDTDRSGTLSAQELMRASLALGCTISQDQLAEMVRKADHSGDGEICYEEFCAAEGLTIFKTSATLQQTDKTDAAVK